MAGGLRTRKALDDLTSATETNETDIATLDTDKQDKPGTYIADNIAYFDASGDLATGSTAMDDLDDLMDVAPLFADTSSGKGGNIFTGHRCTYINCTADGAVSEGDLCVFSTTDWAPNLVRARATGDGFLIIAGVSLDTVSTGLTFRLAIAGSVDARCGNSDTTVSQNAYYKIYGLDAYNMVYTSGGGWQAGVTASPAGTTYSTGWVRIILPR